MRASLANSSGIFLGEPYHFDLVRPGITVIAQDPDEGELIALGSEVTIRVAQKLPPPPPTPTPTPSPTPSGSATPTATPTPSITLPNP